MADTARVFKGGELRVQVISGTNSGVSATYNPQSVVLTRTSNKQTFTGISGVTETITGAPSYTWDITYQQDYSDPTSFAELLWDNDGEDLRIIYIPYTDSKAFIDTVTAEPGNVGGDGTSVAVASVSLSSRTGAPAKVDTADFPDEG